MKHSVQIFGHSTSFSIEPEFWSEFKRIADDKKVSIASLIADIDNNRQGNLSSAIRVFVLNTLKQEIIQNKDS